MSTLTSFQIPSTNQILQSMINDYLAMTTYNGYTLSVDPGSEIYIRFSGIAGQLGVLYNMANILVNSKLIDTATGSDLDRVANDFGLQRRGATPASGFVQLVSGVPISLGAGATLTGPNGLQFEVSVNGTYNNGQNVPVISVDQGNQANLPVGSIMVWSVPQANMQATCLVSVAITGGANAEDDNALRNRLYLTLQAPPQAGNSQYLTNIAGNSDGSIQQAFVYSNFNGAGTQLIALTGYQTSSYIGRDIPHLPTDGYVQPYGLSELSPGLVAQPTGYGPYNQYSLGTDNFGVTGAVAIGNPGSNLSTDTSTIYGQLPGPVANPYATVITTVNNTPSDIAAVLTLPYPVGAPNNGYGNGWQDFTPWPNPDGVYVDDYCKVTAVTSTTNITIAAPSSGLVHTTGNGMTGAAAVSAQTYSNNTPTPNATHIQWVNRSDYADDGWQVVTATITSATDNGNDTWTVTLDTPLVYPVDGYDFYNKTQVTTGQFIFPASINAQSYLNCVMQQYALLGPGQVTSSQGLLVLGASRYPSPNAQFPTTVGVQLERALVSNNTEVYAASVNPEDAYNSAYNVPGVNSPPNIWIPRHIAFHPIEFYNFGVT
jgi:Baseplate J-like protein